MFSQLARRDGRPLIVGHRGAMGYAPENTFASFERAVALGVDAVECDVHLSADGVPVVIHDHTLDRTTDGQGPVRARTLAELKRLDAGSWRGAEFAGQRLPTLDELLEWCAGRVPLSIELKNGPTFYDGLAEQIVELVRRRGMLARANVISFDHQAIRRVKELEPRLAAGVLFAARLVDAPAAARAAGAETIMPAYYFATSDVIEQTHAAGLTISVWTVDDPATAAELARRGVDAIASNYPDRVAAAIRAS
jgi:glycerophosphoryl diester phosphodiesterase